MWNELSEFIKSVVVDPSNWVTAVGTMAIALVSIPALLTSRKAIAIQTNPCVIVTVVHEDQKPTILQLIVKNIGNGVAYDIQFEHSRPLPKNAFGLSHVEKPTSEIFTSGPLIDGIPALGPGETRKFHWGQFGGLKTALGQDKILTIVHCKNLNQKKMKPMKCPLDIDSHYGVNFSDTAELRNMKEIANSLKVIQQRLIK